MEPILGFGAERFPLEPRVSREDRETRSRIMLARALNLRTVVAFIGSGCSAPLGYPTWRQLVTSVVTGTQGSRGDWEEEIRDRLAEIHTRLTSTEALAARDLIFYLGYCQSLLKGRGEDFHGMIAAQIEAAAAKAPRDAPYNPYRALLELPIDRFVTSNYDCELEAMLKEARHIGAPLSFTQEREYYGHLAGFALAGIPSVRDAVFHCHGRHDRPDSIMATEADYQRWYLDRGDPAASTFRQSLDLLFGSNPVLFVGFGMEDDDLLRPLRVFSADNPDQKPSRPLFALMPDAGEPRDHDRMDSLYDRYGVNVIPYPWPAAGEDPAVRGAALCRALRGLRREWRRRADHWARKPAIREVAVPKHPPDPYRHYSVVLREEDELAPATTKHDVEVLFKLVQDNQTRVVVITGDGGSGKSWRVLKLLERVKNDRRRFTEGGIFFWSSYYTDDWLTGLDRALAYLERAGPGAKAGARARRLSRFRDCLHSGEHLLIFDGFERLLRETDDPKTGTPYSRSVEELLDIISEHEDGKTLSTVVLTTRLIPGTLQGRAHVRQFAVRRLTTDDLAGAPLFGVSKQLKEVNLSRLCSLCGGHSYALLLAAKYLTQDLPGLRRRMQTFRREISRRAPDSRVAATIALAIDAADRRTHGVASRLLDRVAVFMSPVDASVLDLCFEAARSEAAEEDGAAKAVTRDEVVEVLREAMLLLEVSADLPEEPSDPPEESADPSEEPADLPEESADQSEEPADLPEVSADQSEEPADLPEEPADPSEEPADLPEESADPPEEPADQSEEPADLPEVSADLPEEPADASEKPAASGCPGLLTVHPIVRSLVFQRSHGAETNGLPNFTLAGFTSGNAACHPGDERGAARIRELLDTFCAGALRARDPRVRRSMCRAAFGVMRSRMESNTVPRWTRYDDYVRLGVRLLYLTKTLSPEHWDYLERTHAAKVQSPDGILYADELAWLYNDIGLALCSEGYMADAYALWEQGYEIDRVTDSEEEGGQYIVQSRLHMSHLFLELGRLRRAAQYLATTERANAIYGDVDFRGRILGYRGLLAHLAGNLDEAEALYRDALGELKRDGRRNLRAESMFQRHWADLLMAVGDLEAAERHVETALSRAREGSFPDLEAYARKSRGHLRRQEGRLEAAQAEYGAALQRARDLGIKRLQADTHSELARLALAVGDWETARVRAIHSLILANELNLGLRRTHGLVVLGLTAEAGGDTRLAASYLQHAYALAERQGYHLRGREAEQSLQRLGAPAKPAPAAPAR